MINYSTFIRFLLGLYRFMVWNWYHHTLFYSSHTYTNVLVPC